MAQRALFPKIFAYEELNSIVDKDTNLIRAAIGNISYLSLKRLKKKNVPSNEGMSR